MSKDNKNLYITYAAVLGITTILWLLAKGDVTLVVRFPVPSLVQISALFAAVLVSLNLMLAARLKFFEDFFGGLDKVYRQHKITGKIAFYLMLIHPTLLLFKSSSFLINFQSYFLNFSVPAYNYGKIALLGFATLVALTIYIKLAYHVWLITHRFIILPLIFLTLHVATIPSDVSYFLPLRAWVMGALLVGIAIYVYKVILYKYIGPKHLYSIKDVNSRGQIVEIILSPSRNKLNFEPGQFVFAVFSSKSVSSEEHPFSISSSPLDSDIRLSIKKSGDFTLKLSALKSGESVSLFGPYGQFGKRALSTNKKVVMVAGGIGVTPFLSIIKYAYSKNIVNKFQLVYSYKNDSESQYKEELLGMLSTQLATHNSDKHGHLTAENVGRITGGLSGKLVLLCGPKRMMKDLTEQMLKVGVDRQNIIFEDFDLK